MSTNLSFENTDSFLIENRVFAPTSDVVANAHITAYMQSKGFGTYEDFYQWSLAHRNEFWEELHWFEPWQTTFAWTEKPFFKWFDGGKFNIVYNCLDRYMQSPTRSNQSVHHPQKRRRGFRRTGTRTETARAYGCGPSRHAR